MDLEDADDPMEIDEPIPVTPIIERRSDEFQNLSSNVSSTETPRSANTIPASNTNNLETLISVINNHPKLYIICLEAIHKLRDPRIMRCPEGHIMCKHWFLRSTTDTSNSASIVILDDDDDDPPPSATPTKPSNTIASSAPVKEIIDLVEKPKSSRCINNNCKADSLEFIFAPDFCLSYFRVKKSSSNREEICMACYDQAMEDNDKLATSLQEGELLFKVDFPIINETLQIDDSDEEDEGTGEMEFISDENFKFISDNIEEVLMETIEKLDLKNHLDKERLFLKEEAKKVETDCEDLTNKVKEIRTVLDKIQIDLYNQFRPDLRPLKGIVIVDDYSLSQAIQIRPEIERTFPESSRKSTRLQQKPVSSIEESSATSASIKADTPAQPEVEIPKDLPCSLLTDKPVPQTDEIYYITRITNPQGSWIKARLQQTILPNTTYDNQVWTTTRYKLVELKQQKERILDGKNIAYMSACKSRLSVGTRVVAAFKEINQLPGGKKPKNDPYYAGVVGEHPVESNKYRYLIFFDIGYAQYVPHSGINLVFDASANVWEDMPPDSRSFIRKYLESQDRPMVKLLPNQTVRVEYNGRWWLSTIKAVDCSLVQVYFDALNRWEWIYRGSTRLSPMFREELAATKGHTGLRPSRKMHVNESATVVQYTRNNDFVQSTPQESTPPGNTRAVARKSTTRPNAVSQPAPHIVPFLPPVNNTPTNVTGPTSKIMYFTPRDQQVTRREYRAHECDSSCQNFLTHNFNKLRGHNPLSKPLLCGWARMTIKDRGRKEIIYKAPCGRMIRNISEIHYYLRVTNSDMTVDLFDFNHMVRCLAEFSVECNPDPKDLSKGLEHVPIPVINGFNNDMLDFCNYSIKRVPMQGVHMNLDADFLCGCDCDDDCVDKLKCSCWKLTLDGLRYLGKDVDPISVGYIYRRLQEQVITGIYECNSRCKCTATCLNRVAQNPMSLKLQVFKTHNRGWGIRCLNDIPQGTFICIYAGTLHTEQMANEDGMQFGDEYFAELDYIETVEKYKEDYEEEVMEDEIFRGKSPPPIEEKDTRPQKGPGGKKRNSYLEDNDFTPKNSLVLHTTNTNTPDGIRSRLRKRKDEDERKDQQVKVKQEIPDRDIRAIVDNIAKDIDTVTISDDEDEGREILSFNPRANSHLDDRGSKYVSVRELFGSDEKDNIYIMDAKNAGNIGRFLNHSCSPNVYVQNVFVDTHDVRFPWVAFFSSQFIRAGTELTWNYNYDIGSVPGRVLYCHCASLECKGRLL